MDETMADRVRAVISRAAPSQAAFAEGIGMTRDKLSKSLGGARRFTSLELALIAEAGDVTVDWLLNGPTPAHPALAARSARGTKRSGGGPDPTALEDATGRYLAAFDVLSLLSQGPELPELPTAPEDGTPHEQGDELARRVLAALRAAGVGPLAELETGELIATWARAFGVDVAITRLPSGLDGLAWRDEGFRLAIVATHPVWTRQRFTLAHELGHVLAGDAQDLLAESGMAPGLAEDPSEIRANAFAAALLMPEEDVRELAAQATRGSGPDLDDLVLDDEAFAAMVVRCRVSPSALAARLRTLGLVGDRERNRLRRFTTADCHERLGAIDAYMTQAAAANTPLPPVRLVNGLFAAYRSGETTLRPLAALLDSDVDDLRTLLGPPDEPTGAQGPSGGASGDPVFTP
ncbi:XRE family transcriptional regulator [Streptomyces pathocidini]|uniref:XRE family transcriptional regulator n=1 Tax=Streptomyces pathocidini TaxID=1650571 RepID=UPI0033F3DDF7